MGRAMLVASAWIMGGCARPAHAAAGGPGSRTAFGSRLTARIKVVPYGVLGSSSAGQVALEPSAETAFVDPAGLHHIRGGPGGAGGAAGVIYKWLGIYDSPAFPEAVRESITKPLQAKFHAYGDNGEKKCIHVVGPDFRTRHYTREEAEAELAEAYANVFREFRASGLKRLRLLPVSGGIFSGPFGGELPTLTADALAAGFERLSPEEKDWVLAAHVELCIFVEKQVADFQQAFEQPESAPSRL